MGNLETVLEKTGRILTEQYGIRIVCEGNRCCTDGRTIYLPALPDDVPEDLWKTIRGYVDHEGAHHIFRSSFSVAKEFRRKHGDEAFGLLNLLEDLRIERAMAERFPGSRANLAHAYAAAEKSATETAAAGKTIPFMRQLAFIAAARMSGRSAPSFVEASVLKLAKEIEHEITAPAAAPNTKAVARLAESAWEKIIAHRPASAKSGSTAGDTSGNLASSKSDPSTGTADGGSSDKETTGTSGPSGDGMRDTSRRRKKSNSTSITAQTNPVVSLSSGSGTAGEHNSAVGDARASDAGVLGGLATDIANAVQQHATATNAYRVWTHAHDEVSVVSDDSGSTHTYRMAPLLRHVSGVRQKLLQSLMAETRTRWQSDAEDGSLNPRALHRLITARALSETASNVRQDTARRVFRRKVVTKRLKTAVTLLIDVSHSMCGRKLDLARGTAMVLCEALARLHIPVAVWAFSTKHSGALLRNAAKDTGIPAEVLERQYRFAPLVHERFKDFDESFAHISGRFDRLRTHMLTPLGESMLFAARELSKRREPRRILLVLTDGRPTVGLDNDVSTFNHAHDAIRRIERTGMEVLLVGMVERCVLDLHKRAVVVDDLDQLSRTVMAQLRTLLSDRTRTSFHHATAS